MFAQYPYLNLNDFNLDYILKAIKDMRYEVTNFVSINAIKYANPIQWDITRQYEKNTIVIDPVTGTAYISVAPVPVGVALTRPEYWTVVFDLQSFVTKANQNLANNYEEQTTTTATMNTAAGAWVIWGDVLYKALVNITAGDAYVVGSNIQRIVIEDVIKAIMQDIANEVQARQNADTTLQGNIDAEVLARQGADNTLQGNIDAEVLARQGADNTLQGNIDSEHNARVLAETSLLNADTAIRNSIGNLSNLNTVDKTNLVAAINETLTSGGKIENVLFIFDSYNTTVGNSSGNTTTISGVMQATSALGIYEVTVSGGGFVRDTGTGTFLSNLTSWVSNHPDDAAKIDMLYVAAGRNDWTATKAQIKTAMQAMKTYANANLPRLKNFRFAYIANGDNSALHGTKTENYACKMNFIDCCHELEITYIPYIDGIIHNYNYMNADGVHPNEYGREQIAYALLQSITDVYINNGTIKTMTIVPNPSYTVTEAATSSTEVYSNCVLFRPGRLIHIDLPSPLVAGNQDIDMGTVSAGCHMRFPYQHVGLPFDVCYQHNGIYVPCTGEVRLLVDSTIRIANIFATAEMAAQTINRIALIGRQQSVYPCDYT